MKKDIFLLDLDETLLDFRRTERENLAETLKRFSLPADGAIIDRFHQINDGLWKLLERGGIEREALKERRFALLCEEYGFRTDVPAIARAYFENFCNICHPFEGSREFLRELKAQGRVYVVTNGAAIIQNRHIADAGFAPFLDGTFISQEVGADKPSQAYADFVCSAIPDFARERAVWLGDSLTSDMMCAKNAGVDFILFAPEGAPAGYEGMCAKNYAEVLEILK